MSKNKERMSYLGTLANLNETLRKNYTKNDIPEKEIKRAYAKDMNELFCQENNGANMPIDQTLRTFLIEYNSRLQKHGFFSFPSSFNVLEAFFKYTRFSKFILREEKDHMLFLEDFMDFITQPTTKINPDEIFNTIEDNLIHNYTMRDIPGTFSFFASKNQYVIQGVSLVKHEDEINILAILGKKADIDKETEKIIKAQTEHGKRFRDVEPDPLLKLEAVRLSPDTNYWKHLVATRYNLKTKTYDVRYVMADCGNSYIIVTDDQNIFVNLPAEKREETLKESITKLQKYLDLFEIIQTFLYLPFYFLKHDESSKIEKHPTNLRTKIWNIPHHEQQKLKPLFKTFF